MNDPIVMAAARTAFGDEAAAVADRLLGPPGACAARLLSDLGLSQQRIAALMALIVTGCASEREPVPALPAPSNHRALALVLREQIDRAVYDLRQGWDAAALDVLERALQVPPPASTTPLSLSSSLGKPDHVEK